MNQFANIYINEFNKQANLGRGIALAFKGLGRLSKSLSTGATRTGRSLPAHSMDVTALSSGGGAGDSLRNTFKILLEDGKAAVGKPKGSIERNDLADTLKMVRKRKFYNNTIDSHQNPTLKNWRGLPTTQNKAAPSIPIDATKSNRKFLDPASPWAEKKYINGEIEPKDGFPFGHSFTSPSPSKSPSIMSDISDDILRNYI